MCDKFSQIRSIVPLLQSLIFDKYKRKQYIYIWSINSQRARVHVRDTIVSQHRAWGHRRTQLSDIVFFIADVWNWFGQILNARVKVPSLIGLFKPPVASVIVTKVTNFSRLEVLGGHSLDSLFTLINIKLERGWVN